MCNTSCLTVAGSKLTLFLSIFDHFLDMAMRVISEKLLRKLKEIDFSISYLFLKGVINVV